MKHLLKILVVLLSFLVSCETYSQQGPWTRPNVSYGTIQYRGSFEKAILLPTGCGVPDSLNAVDLHQFALKGDSCNHKLYFYDPSVRAWYDVAGFGDTTAFQPLVQGRGIEITGGSYDPSHPATIYLPDSVWNLITNINITNGVDTINYFVDDTATVEPAGATNGSKYLILNGASGTFAGHDNEIASLIGGVWNYDIAADGQNAEVTTRQEFYKFYESIPEWQSKSRADLLGGVKGIQNPTIGTRDLRNFSIKTNDSVRFWIDSLGNLYTNLHGNYTTHLNTDANGKIGLYPFDKLILVRDDSTYLDGSDLHIDTTGGNGISSVAWGDITGTLSDQTDLQSALDAKQDNLTLTTTGTSGAATLVGATLNIPNYATAGGGLTFDSTIIATAGQTSFNYSTASIPSASTTVWVLVNGISWLPATGWARTDATHITVTATDLLAGDKVRLRY